MSRRRRGMGVVHLVGAGPGDPGLITVRGRELLSRADVIVADALAPASLLDLAPAGAERVAAFKRGGRASVEQEEVNRILIAHARRGRTVVRLKGGDPSLFGRGGEEAEALRRARVPFSVVPGVTAALGAAAWAGIPLTHRKLASSVVIATGHLDALKGDLDRDWQALTRSDTLVLYMGMRRLSGIVARLLRAGLAPSTPTALVRWATLPDQVVVTGTLGEIVKRARAAGLRPPVLLIAGRVVRLRRRLDWRSRLPLSGRTIVVTRPREQAGPFVETLRDLGARVLAAPAIVLRPPRSRAPLDRALARLATYRYVIFTSANGVKHFFDRLQETGRDVRGLGGAGIVAIGPSTAAAVRGRGLRVAVVPEEFRAEGLIEALGSRPLAGTRILIPRAAVARDVLVKELRRRGAIVDVVPVYRAVASSAGIGDVRAALRRGGIDLITFTSSSTVVSFASRFRGRGDARRVRRVPVAAIGPVTAATARRLGFRVVVTPRAYTVEAMTRALVRRLRNSPSGTPRAS